MATCLFYFVGGAGEKYICLQVSAELAVDRMRFRDPDVPMTARQFVVAKSHNFGGLKQSSKPSAKSLPPALPVRWVIGKSCPY
jgi:hypothetical protein